MQTSVPIVFIHEGYGKYLPYALYQAKAYGGDSSVVLLGGAVDYNGILNESLVSLAIPEVDEFKRVYRHMSTRAVKFELFCWLRWFYLLGYMRKNAIDAVWYFDSDVLIFGSPAEWAKLYPDLSHGCAFSVPESLQRESIGAASAHVSYWSRSRLEEFCRFCIDSYVNPTLSALYASMWSIHHQVGTAGGVCDMTSLFLYAKLHFSTVVSLSKIHSGGVFDHNVNISENYVESEYALEAGLKKIYRLGRNLEFGLLNGGRVEARAVHFQGNAKKSMLQYYGGMSVFANNISNASYWLAPVKRRLTKICGNNKL
jgi:hypothetical protein